MGYRSIPQRALMSAVLVTLSSTNAAAAVEESVGDSRDFTFNAETPYFYQDGKVDFGTYNGFRRYHSDCHVGHGPAGLGSSYAPSLIESMATL
ncbi:MAG: hypothetical protein WBG92_04890, partial [Thiohalocapsa sp.]